jgi:transcriptional regulator with XRE-family HTH domain
MTQRTALVEALKEVLKARGYTYARVAKALGLSEAAMKRTFALKSFTLERFDAICGVVGVEISISRAW